MTSITYTNERDTYIDFSKENVLVLWGQVYMGKDKKFKNILDLQDSKVAILKGGINALNFQNLIEKFQVTCQLIPVDTQLKVFELTSSGRTDAGVLNNSFGTAHEKDYDVELSPILFNPFNLFFAVPEGMNSDITTTIDRQVKLWKENKNSAYYKILNKWHGTVTTQENVIPTWLLFLMGGICCTVMLLSLSRNVLKRQVKLRTSEFEETNENLKEVKELLKISEKRYKILFNYSPVAL